MKHKSVVTFAVLLAVVGVAAAFIACGAKEDPFAVGDREATGGDTTPVLPEAEQPTTASEQATSTDAQTRERLEADDVEGPPQDELIKFANWEENRVKLTNYIAAFIVAHGLDRPVRIIEVKQEDYKQALLDNDVDIVLEAASDWVGEQANGGKVVALQTLSSESPETRIALHASMRERAPDVVDFLSAYAPAGETMRAQAARMTGGRLGQRANTLTLTFLKRSEAMWAPWVEASVAHLVKSEVAKGTVTLCREWAIRFADVYKVEYCKDDPSVIQPDQ